MDVQPGAMIRLEIVTLPRSTANRKTLVRLCAKDPAIQKLDRYRKAHRPSWQTKRRGGRFWHHQFRSHSAARVAIGETFSLRASVDVLRDLPSIAKLVKISAA